MRKDGGGGRKDGEGRKDKDMRGTPKIPHVVVRCNVILHCLSCTSMSGMREGGVLYQQTALAYPNIATPHTYHITNCIVCSQIPLQRGKGGLGKRLPSA